MLNTVRYLNCSHRSKTMDINQKSLTSPSSVQVTGPTLDVAQEHQEQISDLAIQNQASEKDRKSGLLGVGAVEGVIEDSLDKDTGIVELGSQKSSSLQAKKSERTISVAEILRRTKSEKDAKAVENGSKNAEKDAKVSTILSNDVTSTHNALSVDLLLVDTLHSKLVSPESSSTESISETSVPAESICAESSLAKSTSAAPCHGNLTAPTDTSHNNNPFLAELSTAESLVAESSSVSVSEPSKIHVSASTSTQKKIQAATYKTKKSQHTAKCKQSESVGSTLTTDSNLSLAEQIDVAASVSLTENNTLEVATDKINHAASVVSESNLVSKADVVSEGNLDRKTNLESTAERNGATELEGAANASDVIPTSDILPLAPDDIENLVSGSESTESSEDQCTVIQLDSEWDKANKQPPLPAANYRHSIHELQQSAASEGIMLNINEELLNLPDEEICKLGVVEIKGSKNSIKEFCKFTFKDAALGKKVIDIQLNTDNPEQLSKLLPQSNDVSLDKFIKCFALYTGRLVDPNYAKYRQQIAIMPENSQEYEAYFTRLHNIFLFGQTATIEDFFSHAFKRPTVDKILERYLPYGSVPLKSLYRMHVRYSALSRLDAGAESIMNCNIQYPELMQVSATPLVTSKNQDALDTAANSKREQGLAPAITSSSRIEQPEVQYQRQFANLAYDSVFPNKAEHGNNDAFSNQAANQGVNLGSRTDIEQAAYLNQGCYPYQTSNLNQAFDPNNTSNLNQGGYGNNQVTVHSTYDTCKTKVQITHHPQNVGQQNTTCVPVFGSSSIANDAFKAEVYAVAGNIEGQEAQYVNRGQQINRRQYVNAQRVHRHQYAYQTQQVNPESYANQGQSQFHQVPMQKAYLVAHNVSTPQFPNQAYGRYQNPNFMSNTNPSLNQNGACVVEPNCSQHFASNSHVTSLQHMGNKSPYSAGNTNTCHSSHYFAQGAYQQLGENLSHAAGFGVSRQNLQYRSEHHSNFSQVAGQPMAAVSSINNTPNMREVPPRMDVSYGSYQPYQAAKGFPAMNVTGVSHNNMIQSNVQSYAPVDATSRLMHSAYNETVPSSIISNQTPAQMPYSTNQSLMHQDSRASYQGTNVAESQVQSSSFHTNRQQTAQWENQGSNVKRRVTDPQT